MNETNDFPLFCNDLGYVVMGEHACRSTEPTYSKVLGAQQSRKSHLSDAWPSISDNRFMNGLPGITTGSPKYTEGYFSKTSKRNGKVLQTPEKQQRIYESLPSQDEEMTLPWYHQQMLPDNVDSPAAENSTNIINTEL